MGGDQAADIAEAGNSPFDDEVTIIKESLEQLLQSKASITKQIKGVDLVIGLLKDRLAKIECFSGQ
jgi:hypothetical protein